MQELYYNQYCEICETQLSNNDDFTCNICKIGLCNNCKNMIKEEIKNTNIENIRNCQICKIEFEDFCQDCKEYALENYETFGMEYENMTEFLENNFDYCDCEEFLHCYKDAERMIKHRHNLVIKLHETNSVLLCTTCVEQG